MAFYPEEMKLEAARLYADGVAISTIVKMFRFRGYYLLSDQSVRNWVERYRPVPMPPTEPSTSRVIAKLVTDKGSLFIYDTDALRVALS